MYLYESGLLPEQFHNYFLLINEVYIHNTRNAKFYCLPLCRTNISQFSIKYQGPKFFNTPSFDTGTAGAKGDVSPNIFEFIKIWYEKVSCAPPPPPISSH